MLDRPLPYDRQAESGVIGSVWLDPRRLDDVVATGIQSSDFYDQSHEILFNCLKLMHASGIRPDLVLVRDMLMSQGKFEQVGGMAYIGKMINAVPHSDHAAYYAQIVKRNSQARALIILGTTMAREAYAEGSDPTSIMSTAESEIAAIKNAVVDPAVLIGESMDGTIDSLAALAATGSGVGLGTGLHCCDSTGMAFVPSELSVIAAQPSVGKTAWAFQVCLYHGRHKVPTFFGSVEMPLADLNFRLLVSEARLDAKRLRDRINPDDVVALRRAKLRFEGLPIYTWAPRDGARASTIDSVLSYYQARHGIKLAFVDYLQLLDPEPGMLKANEAQQIGDSTKILKRCARRLGLPICTLAQLNREGADCRPTLKNLRGSGAIEQHADTVGFLWLLEKVKGDPRDRRGFSIAKGRNFGTSECVLHFHGEETRFSDPDHIDDQKELPF